MKKMAYRKIKPSLLTVYFKAAIFWLNGNFWKIPLLFLSGLISKKDIKFGKNHEIIYLPLFLTKWWKSTGTPKKICNIFQLKLSRRQRTPKPRKSRNPFSKSASSLIMWEISILSKQTKFYHYTRINSVKKN